jgi:hypothetical protein
MTKNRRLPKNLATTVDTEIFVQFYPSGAVINVHHINTDLQFGI